MKNSSRAGFTLIELLVVIAIIAILVGILLPVLGVVRRNAKESATRAFMKSIETACAAYEFDWGFYPPDGLTNVVNGKTPSGGSIPNVKSSSSLYYHLCTPFRILPTAAKGEVTSNKDVGAYLDVPEKHKIDKGGGKFEICDVWKNVLSFDNIRDPQGSPTGFDSVPSTEIRDQATLMNNPGTAGRNVQSFDIWSLGDGSNGTAATSTRPLANFKCKWEGN